MHVIRALTNMLEEICCSSSAGFDELLQQEAHALSGDGAALQRRLQAGLYEEEEKLSAAHLMHTLQSLLRGGEDTQRGVRLINSA
ncbi:hypothetical protein F7725_021174 [Dissostichus mawsoni]|uniref:Uncharacterized protein n=1 Tax=Dissostichus mawsoni TaxID=36200 RepID=A0A7J5YF96_DISMA|nr:hypothetical protein F7725_021174 [Dissostichus mawsoni]